MDLVLTNVKVHMIRLMRMTKSSSLNNLKISLSLHTEGLGFDSRASQIGIVANGSPPLQRFIGVVLPKRLAAEMGPATR